MGISVRTNLASLSAQTQMKRTTRSLNQSIVNLASGQRINVASDDPAGLAISEKLRSNIRSLDVAQRNANDGISLLQQAEGALSSVGDILLRMRELAMQAATDTLTNSDRTFLNDEFAALKTEIDRISDTTTFNGQTLIDGTFSGLSMDFQVGVHDGGSYRVSVTLSNVGTESLGSNTANLSSSVVSTKTTAQGALAVIDSAINDIATLRSRLGSKQQALNTVLQSAAVAAENFRSADSRIRDIDMASETANFSALQILQQAGAAMLAQANTQPQIALQLLQG